MRISKRTFSLFLFLTALHAPLSQGQEDILPNIAAFPDGPPAPGDIFEEPAVVTNANEQVALDAVGDTATVSPALEDPTPPPDLVVDAVEGLPSVPTGLEETPDVPTEAPSANGDMTADLNPTGEILPEGIIETVETAQGETPLVESGPEVISVGDGVIAVDNMETTTPITDVPMTTVDSNFDPQGTFDGRNDPILLTGTTLPANSSKVLGNLDNRPIVQDEVLPVVPGQDTAMAETRSEFPIGIEAETTTATLTIETENVVDEAGATGINALNEQVNPATEILTPEAIPDITELTNTSENDAMTTTDLNTIVSINTPSTNDVIENTAEKPIVVDQKTPSEFMDVTVAEVPNYEEKLNEFKEFVKKNPNTTFPAPPMPPPRKPPASQLTRETSTPLVVADEIAVISTTEPVPGPSLEENTPLPPSEAIVRPEPSKPTLKTGSVAKEPSRPPSIPLLPRENNLKEKSLPPSKPTLGSPKVALSNSGTIPKSTTISKPRLKALSNVVPAPPPPPSDVFRKDFNENTNKKANMFKYEPKIPFDPDFDFKPNDRTETANQRSTLTKTTNVPSTRQLRVDVQSIYDKNSLPNNAFPLSVAKKRPQKPISTQRDRGVSLYQYQINNKDDVVSARKSNVRERNENPTKVRKQSSGQGSNDMQALFDKTRKFVANFGAPGMPISSNYFNQNHGGQINNANIPNVRRNQPFETVWSPSSPNNRLQQNKQNSLQSFESKNTMPPITVVEDGSSLNNRNTASVPVSKQFNQRDFKNLNIARTNAPYTENKMGNSLEMWYQLRGKYFPKDEIKNFQNGVNVGTNAQNIGGEEFNTFFSVSKYKRNQMRQNLRLRNDKVNNENRKRAGGLAPISSQSQINVQKPNAYVFNPKKQRFQIEDTKTVQRRTPETTAQVSNNNAIPFEPQRQRFQIENTKNIQRREPPKPTISRNNAFAFKPRKQTFQGDFTRDSMKQLKTKQTARRQNAFIFEPQLQRSQIEVAEPYRIKIKEYLVTGKPNTVSTTEARLNMGVPTLSYSLEPPDMFSQDNPPPINIDGKFDNIAFQSFITTTARPNTLPQPSMLSPSAFRIRQRNTQTPNDSSRKSVASIANLPRPPPIKFSGPSFSSTLNKNSETNSVLSQKEKDINVETKLNAVPYEPAKRMLGPKISKISDLPRPPAINFAGSSGSGTGKDSNIEITPIAGGSIFKEIPEITPVPPLFSVNSTIVMKLQNDSVTKEELHPSVCHQCHYVNDICYLPEAEICNRFVECHRNGDQVRAFEKECAIGNFWNPETLACQKSVYVNCAADPCKNPAVKSHPFLGRCRYFWKCERRTSDFEFCSQNYRYDGIGDTCVPDFTCKDEDPPMDVVQPTEPENCIWTAVEGSLTTFTDGFNVQKCAPGTRFDEVQCTCVISNIIPEGAVCNPDTLIDFEGDELEAFTDKSGNRNGIGKENVRLKDGTGFFYGVGKISFWRYANVELGPLLGIQIRFFPYGYSKNPMGLVSNCNGSPIGSTVDIRLDTKTKQAIFKLSTNKQRNNQIVLPYEPFKWNTATYVYAGDTFTASINDKKETIPVEGSIPNRHPAIQVGGCNREDGFRGYADDVKIYNGCIPDEFEYIIFT